MQKSIFSRGSASGLVLTTLLLAAPSIAHAQSQAETEESREPEVGEDDIIVTGQKIATTLSKTPAAIVAIGGDNLRDAGVADPRNLSAEVAGVRLATVGAVSNLSIRGIGSTQFSALGGPAVGISYANVPIEGSLSINGAFYDLERIEVLKGPQGTLYGLNATAGVLNILPKRPDLGHVGGSINLEVGNYETRRAEAAVNLPIGNTLALRVAGLASGHAAYFTNGYNDANDVAARAQLLWEPDSRFSILLSADYMHQGGRGSTDAILPFGNLGTDASKPYDQKFAPDNGEAYQDSSYWGVQAEISADLGFANLTVIPAYRENNHKELAFRTSYRAFNDDPSWQTSVEARLDGTVGDLTWLVGGYLFEGERRFDLDSVRAAGLSCAPAPVGVVQEFYSSGCYTLTGIRSQHFKKSEAAFGQLTYEIAPGLKLTGGIRYSHDYRRTVQTNYSAKAGVPAFAIFFSGPPPLARDVVVPDLTSTNPAVVSTISYDTAGNFHSVDYKLGLSYEIGASTLVYANFATGYKSGGVNDGSDTLYEPEKLYSYEMGIRTRLFDTLRLHLNGFYWDYRNHQEGNVFFVAGVGNVFQITNIPKGHLYGADLEVEWRPTPADTLTAQVAYLESDTGAFSIPVAPAYSTTGQDYVTAPRWSVNLSYAHSFSIGTMELEPRVSTQISSSYNANIFNSPDTRQDGYMKSDFALTLRPQDGNWSVSAFVRNIENEAVIVSSTAAPGTRQFWGYLGNPRTYGARLGFTF